jgi:ankyrin repeat protein
LNGGADIEAVGEDGRTPLHRTSYFNKVAVVKLLLEKGANISGRRLDGGTPLHSACRHKRYPDKLLFVLLECGADVKSKNNNRETVVMFQKPLSWKALKLLLERDVDIEVITRGRRRCALQRT